MFTRTEALQPELSTPDLDPRLLGSACVGTRLVALARAAVAMHMAAASGVAGAIAPDACRPPPEDARP